MHSLKKACLAGAVAFWFLLLAGCSAAGNNKARPKAGPTPVLIAEVQPHDIAVTADFPAQTYARDMVEVRGRVSGYVEQWLFHPGAEVRAGDVLYVLDVRPYEAAVAQAKGNVAQSEADVEFARRQVSLLQAEANLASAQATLVKAQQDHERLTPLAKADAASRQDLDAAAAALKAGEANVAALKANVEQTRLSTRTQIEAMRGKLEAQRGALRNAELNLLYATIRAPIAGRAGDSLVPVGGLVNPSSAQPLTTIVPLDPIWVRFKVSEAEYLAFARQGQRTPGGGLPVTLILADKTELPAKGRVENTLNQVDPKTGTLELQASFPNPGRRVLPGQFGRVRMQIEQRHGALVIPQRAVQQLQNIQTVYALTPQNTVELRAITPGARIGSDWIIDKGLKPGDRVIVEGQLKVRPGVQVEPRPYRAGEEEKAGS